jgi:hypothetical protein
MPVQKVDGGWRWGTGGKLYKGKGAREKAAKQGYAAMNNGYREKGTSPEEQAARLFNSKK